MRKAAIAVVALGLLAADAQACGRGAGRRAGRVVAAPFRLIHRAATRGAGGCGGMETVAVSAYAVSAAPCAAAAPCAPAAPQKMPVPAPVPDGR